MSELVGIDTTKVSTNLQVMPSAGLGQIFRLKHATYGKGAWTLIKASESLPKAGQWVHIAEVTGAATLMDTTESAAVAGLVGVIDAIIASGSYGYAWVGEGTMEAILGNGVSAGVSLTTTGTAGEAGTGGDAIEGASSVDAGVTDTRVTVTATGITRTN